LIADGVIWGDHRQSSQTTNIALHSLGIIRLPEGVTDDLIALHFIKGHITVINNHPLGDDPGAFAVWLVAVRADGGCHVFDYMRVEGKSMCLDYINLQGLRKL
jgi:hypothetical protein